MMGGGGSSSAPRCEPTSCTCKNGLVGMTSCETQTCDCSACPEFTPGADLELATCAGDPTGVWRLAQREESRFEFHFDYPDGGLSSACSGQNTRKDQTHDWLLQLRADGHATLQYTSPETEVDFKKDCLDGDHATCASVTDPKCEDLDCELCRCKIPSQSAVLDLAWAVDKSVLTLSSNAVNETFSLCATSDQLHLQTSSRGLQLDFERVYFTGRPTPCAERSPVECGQGSCRSGACVGTGSCDEGTDSVTCAQYADCEWDATACSGSAPPRCAFRDYVDHTLGCEMSDEAPHCAGTPLPCAAQPSCLAKGCLVGSACTGGEQTCTLDEGVPGCTCTSSTHCSGTFDCADLNESRCQTVTGSCTWNTQACIATATPCAQLTASQCELTAGCFFQSP